MIPAVYKSLLTRASLAAFCLITFQSVKAQPGGQTRPLPAFVEEPALPKAAGHRSASPVASSKHGKFTSNKFLVTTTAIVDGYNIVDYRGLVEGSSVRVPTWSEDSAAGTEEIYGGNVNVYAQLCEEARMQAFSTMVKRARKLGANAVIGIHFDSQVMPLDKGKFASGVVCVGTAVIVRKSSHYGK